MTAFELQFDTNLTAFFNLDVSFLGTDEVSYAIEKDEDEDLEHFNTLNRIIIKYGPSHTVYGSLWLHDDWLHNYRSLRAAFEQEDFLKMSSYTDMYEFRLLRGQPAAAMAAASGRGVRLRVIPIDLDYDRAFLYDYRYALPQAKTMKVFATFTSEPEGMKVRFGCRIDQMPGANIGNVSRTFTINFVVGTTLHYLDEYFSTAGPFHNGLHVVENQAYVRFKERTDQKLQEFRLDENTNQYVDVGSLVRMERTMTSERYQNPGPLVPSFLNPSQAQRGGRWHVLQQGLKVRWYG